MKKLSIIVLMALATAGQAVAGGMNQAVTEEVVEPAAQPAGVGSGAGLVIGLLVLGGLAAAASSTNNTRP